MTTVIISNDEINDIIEIVKSLEDSGLLLKGVTETVQNEVKKQKGGFLSMLLGTLSASLLGNKWIFNAASSFTNFEIQKYQNEPRFNGVYSRDNLTKIKGGAYVINLDEYSDIGTHWVALYANNDVTYFESFGIEHIPKEIKTFIDRSLSIVICPPLRVTINISRIQAYDSIMCGYFCIGFIDFMLAGKTLTEFTNLFLPNN